LNKKSIGQIGIVNESFVQGWGKHVDSNTPVKAKLFVNNSFVDETIANQYRPNLEHLSPTGNCGFRFDLSRNPLKEGDIVSVQLEGSDNFLNNSDFIFVKNKKRCILHIGMHKTGSSSIQHNLFLQKDDLNFGYFDIGENHSIPIYSMFCDYPENYHIHQRANRNIEQIGEINKEYDALFRQYFIQTNYETYLLSGEDIAALSENALVKFKKYLKMFFDEIEIIAYVRPFGSFISSAFQENVKNNGLSGSDFQIAFPHYRRFEKFYSVFDDSKIRLYVFDPKTFKNNDVVSDFCEKIELKIDESKKINTNESLSLEAIAMIYVYYKTTQKSITFNIEKLYNLMKGIGSHKLRFCNSMIKEFAQKNKEDLEWIEKKMGMSMDDTDKSDEKDCIASEDQLVDVALKSYTLLEPLLPKNFRYGSEKVSVEQLVKSIDCLL